MITFVELERVWKEMKMAYFKVLSWNLPGWTEGTHENRIISLLLTFGLGIPQIQS
jgi:hypothetical protein